jgi:hypothetical protein
MDIPPACTPHAGADKCGVSNNREPERQGRLAAEREVPQKLRRRFERTNIMRRSAATVVASAVGLVPAARNTGA